MALGECISALNSLRSFSAWSNTKEDEGTEGQREKWLAQHFVCMHWGGKDNDNVYTTIIKVNFYEIAKVLTNRETAIFFYRA